MNNSKLKQKMHKLLPYMGLPLIGVIYLLIKPAEAIEMARYELLIIAGYIIAVTDLKDKKIPNTYVLAMLTAWILTIVPQLYIDTPMAVEYIKNAAVGFSVGGGLFLLIYLISRKGLGGGDVKFMTVAGLYMGFGLVLPAMLYGSILAALVSIILIALKRIDKKDSIPLAPFLYAGILVTIFAM